MSLTLKLPNHKVLVAAEDIDKLKAASKLIADGLEFADQQEEEDRDFPITVQPDFTEDALLDAFKYLKETKYAPTHYKKVPKGDLVGELQSEFEKSLAGKYTSIPQIRMLHSAAKYLQIKQLQVLSLMFIGRYFKVDENQHDSLDRIKKKWGIQGAYDFFTEKDLKEKYSFLK